MWEITKFSSTWFTLKTPKGSEANFVSFNGAFNRIPQDVEKIIYNGNPMARITILAKRYMQCT